MKYKHVYGPVSSWRLGRSLGVDPVSLDKGKACTFDCAYCQVGRTGIFTNKRKIFVKTARIIEEIRSLPPLKIDYVTFSGAGEPTLAKNLGGIIKGIREIKKWKIAVLTNSYLIKRKDVRKDLSLADFVIAKLDAPVREIFEKINKPVKGIKLEDIIKGLKEFRRSYKGKLALQVMFVKDNIGYAEEIASLAKEIAPDEIQINTPLRPCGLKPLSKTELREVKKFFRGTSHISIYDIKKKKVTPISKPDTLKRRGKT